MAKIALTPVQRRRLEAQGSLVLPLEDEEKLVYGFYRLPDGSEARLRADPYHLARYSRRGFVLLRYEGQDLPAPQPAQEPQGAVQLRLFD